MMSDGSDSDETTSSDGEGMLDKETEISQIQFSIKKRVDLLLRLSISMRDPADHDQFFTADLDTSRFEPFDIHYVQDKLPGIPEDISTRLGKVISKRRLYFKYREAHMSKFAQGLTDQQNSSDDEEVTKLEPPSTIASSLPERVKKLEVVDLDKRDAESEATETSFATSASGSDDHALRIPAIPADLANGDPFECPFCHMVVSISGRRAWK